MLPVPLYFATCGYGQSGRVRSTLPAVACEAMIFAFFTATAAGLSHVAANAGVASRHITAPAANAMHVCAHAALMNAIDNRESEIDLVIGISSYCLS
jgi:hypothetical protein